MAAKSNRRSSWWTDTIKREETINKELTLQIDNRRRRSSVLYGDLNSLLVNKDQLASLSASREKGHGGGSSKFVIKTKEIAEAIEIALATGCSCQVFATSTEGVTKSNILEFLKKIFNLTSAQLEKAQNQTSQQPPPKLQLMCRVIKATELKSKDGNGTHQRSPYCRLGIVNQKYIESSSEFKFLSEWQKAGAVADVATTSTKPATVEPVWNENVKLAVESIDEDMVVVELWDDIHQERKKNLKALISHNKEEFLSWMSHPVHRVSITGGESQFTLTSRSKKTQKGFINLFLRLQADTNKLLEVCLHEHHLLTRALIKECSQDDDSNGHKWNWSGGFCSEAEKLLEYHGSLNGLHKLQMASVHLSELLKYHGLYGVEIQAFYKLILEIKQLEKMFLSVQQQVSEESSSLPANSSSSPIPYALHQVLRVVSPQLENNSHAWEGQLFSDLEKLESDLMDMLNDHIRLVQFGYDGEVEKISLLLSTMMELYSIEAYVHQMEPKKSLGNRLESCIVPSVKNWFSLLKTRVMPSNGSEQKELRDLCSHCLLWTEKAQEQLHPKFMELAGVDYFTRYLKALDEMLSAEVMKLLEDYKGQRVETYTFEMYTTFQHLVEHSEHVEKETQTRLLFLTFHNWFEEFVPGWIKMSREKCESRIEQAIRLDEIVKITKDLKLSTSAVDTRGFLHQMAAFWQHLDWPVASEAYGYAVSMIENMCCCAECYVGKIFGSLNSECLQDEHGRFKASEKLCLIINNMYHVREFLSELPVHMELDNFYARLEKEDKMRDSLASAGSEVVKPGMSLTVRAKSLIGNFVTNADEEILRKVDDVARKICNKLSPDIQVFVNKIIKRKQDENKDKLLNPLFEYLTQNLTTLGNNLLPSVFQSITETLWEVSVGAVEQLSRIPRKKDLLVQQRLLDTLNSLRDFYYCEGDGVSGRALDSDAYLALCSKLNVLCLSTNQLIVHFYSELMKYQQEETRKGNGFGELIISVGYIKEVSAIEVIVVQARDIEMFHEPYVKLRLSSTCKSADKHWKTKPVKGGSKAPSFSEEFILPVTEEEMKSDGSLLIFYLLDKKLKSKSHAGMCAVACRDIPHLYHTSLKRSISDPTAPQRRNFNLPLFQFSTETPALTELFARTDSKDVNAVRFMKMNELLLGNIPHPTSPKFGRSRSKAVE